MLLIFFFFLDELSLFWLFCLIKDDCSLLFGVYIVRLLLRLLLFWWLLFDRLMLFVLLLPPNNSSYHYLLFILLPLLLLLWLLLSIPLLLPIPTYPLPSSTTPLPPTNLLDATLFFLTQSSFLILDSLFSLFFLSISFLINILFISIFFLKSIIVSLISPYVAINLLVNDTND